MEKVQVLKVDTEKAQTSIKELRKSLKEFKDQMASVEEGGDAFNALAKEASEVDLQIKEINKAVRLASKDLGDMIGNATTAAAGLVGGFQAVEGALQVMGVESEAVGDALLRMQGLMAITEGLAAIEESIDAFRTLGDTIKVATSSAGGLKRALVSTGIGAIVVAVGTIVAYWEDISKWIGISNTRLETQKRLSSDVVAGFQLVDDIIEGTLTNEEKLITQQTNLTKTYSDLQEAIKSLNTTALTTKGLRTWKKELKEQGIEVENTRDILAVLEDRLYKTGNALEITSRQLSQYDDNSSQGQKNLIQSFEDVILKIGEYRIKSAEGYQLTTQQQREYNQLLEEEILLKDRIKNTNWGLQYLNSQYQDLVKQMQSQVDKATADTAKAYADMANVILREEIGFIESKINRLGILHDEEYYNMESRTNRLAMLYDEEYYQSIEYIRKMEHIFALEMAMYDRQSVEYRNVYNARLSFLKEMDLLVTKMDLPGKMLLDELQALRQGDFKDNFFIQVGADMQEFVANLKPVKEETKKTYSEIYTTFSGVASGITSVMSMTTSVLSTLATNQATETKEGFEKQKQFNIAAATMNGLMGILNAWVSAMSPTNAWMTLPGQIAMGVAQTAATATLMGIQIDAIRKQTMGGSSSGSTPSAAGIGAVTAAPVRRDVNGASITQALNQQNNTRVYVLESDITNTQNKVNVQEKENVF